MDTKHLILGILIITMMGLGWQYFVLYEYSKHPEWKRPEDQTASSTENASASSATSAASASTQPAMASAPTRAATQPSLAASPWRVAPAAEASAATQPATVLLGSLNYQDPHYHMGVSIIPTGAAVESVGLNQYHQKVDNPEIYVFQTPYDQDPQQEHSLQTVALTIDGDRLDLWNKNFALIRRTGHSARYALLILHHGEPAVRLIKQYELDPASDDPHTSQGYELQVNYQLQGLAALPAGKHKVSLIFNGPTVPQAESVREEAEIVAGYNDTDLVRLDHQYLAGFSAKDPSKDYVPNADKLPMLWMGATSTYFNAFVHPLKTGLLAKAVATALNPQSESQNRVVAIRFTTIDFALTSGGTVQVPMRIFLGPKLRSLLDSSYYAAFPLQYDNTLVMVANWFCGLCTFPWLIGFLVSVLNVLHWVFFGDWGLAIIALVLIVRVILHPLTKRSQISMLKMQKLAPEIERLKKKFGDDKEGFGKAQMELYKSVGFTPILGCLPMFLQMPIFIALWQALETTFELRQAPFLEFFGVHLTWIHDLSQPDQLIKFAKPVPLLLFGWHLSGINALPIAMAVVTFINQKYFTPKPAAATPEQAQQQKMMTWMTMIFPFMFYTFPSGLNLYYLTSTSLGILESKVVRDHIKRLEEAEKETGPVVVDAGKPSRAARRRGGQTLVKAPPKKGWMARLQDRAEQIARESQNRKR